MKFDNFKKKQIQSEITQVLHVYELSLHFRLIHSSIENEYKCSCCTWKLDNRYKYIVMWISPYINIAGGNIVR
jgi:hypothetical protein